MKSTKKTQVGKDKTYVLMSSSSPICFMLQSKNSKSSPLLYFDEETNENRALRYAKNQKSPFEDEQDGNAILEHVMFEDGSLHVPYTNPTLQKFLDIHPANGSLFKELDHEAIAKDEKDALLKEIDALVTAKGLEVSVAESILRVYAGANVDSMTTSEIKRDILIYAKKSPREFLEALEDPTLTLDNTVARSFTEGIFITKNNGRDIYYNLENNKLKLLTIPSGETAEQALSAFFLTPKGLEVMKMVESKLN
jgi:hypothetical protein